MGRVSNLFHKIARNAEGVKAAARLIVAETKKRKLNGRRKPKGVPSDTWHMKALGWGVDEISISNNDDRGRVVDVLSFIQRDDEMDRIVAKAEREVPHSKVVNDHCRILDKRTGITRSDVPGLPSPKDYSMLTVERDVSELNPSDICAGKDPEIRTAALDQ